MKKVWWTALLLAVLLLVSFGGCDFFGSPDVKESSTASEAPDQQEEEDPEYPVTAGGVTLPARPGKVISLSPALTEKIGDLGMQSQLAGISDYCDFPKDIAGLPLCGTAQLPDVAAIIGLSPHLVLTQSPLPREAADALETAGIPVALFPPAETVAQLADTYTGIASLLEGDMAGQAIGESVASTFQNRVDNLAAAVSSAAEGNPKKVVYLRLLDYTVATGDTFEGQLLAAVGLHNIAAEETGWAYPEKSATSAEGKAAFASADLIYMDKDFVTIKDLEQSTFYKGLPATIQDRYLYLSSVTLERQSFRSLDTLTEMVQAAYPDLALDAPISSDTQEDEENEYGPDDDTDQADT